MTHFRSMSGEPVLEPDGSITIPGGGTYARTPERIKRKTGATYVAAGAAVVTDVYPAGLRVYVGSEAGQAWAEIAPRLMSGPDSIWPADYVSWSGHVYESEAGLVLLYFKGDH
jgi:hypothetical protein